MQSADYEEDSDDDFKPEEKKNDASVMDRAEDEGSDVEEEKPQKAKSEQKLRFASVPYKVNPDPNYGSMSTEQGVLMPDITNVNLTASNVHKTTESIFEKVSCGDYNTYAVMSI